MEGLPISRIRPKKMPKLSHPQVWWARVRCLGFADASSFQLRAWAWAVHLSGLGLDSLATCFGGPRISGATLANRALKGLRNRSLSAGGSAVKAMTSAVVQAREDAEDSTPELSVKNRARGMRSKAHGLMSLFGLWKQCPSET